MPPGSSPSADSAGSESIFCTTRFGPRPIPAGSTASIWHQKEVRNAAESSIEWRFKSDEARIKLKNLYPETVEELSYYPNLS